MTILKLFSSFEWPNIDLLTGEDNRVIPSIVRHRGQRVLRPIYSLVGNSLDALVVPDVPHLHHLIRSKRQ